MGILVTLILSCQDKSITELLQELKSPQKSERRAAKEALEKLGKDAVPELRKVAKADFEIRRELWDIIEAIESGPGLEIFKKIENSVLGAKTISVKCRWQQGDKAESAMNGQIFSDQKNRIRVELSWKGQIGSRDILLVSDGSNACYRPSGDPADKNRQDLRSKPAEGFPRRFWEQLMASDSLAAVSTWGQPNNAQMKDWTSGSARSRMLQVRVGEPDNGAGTLTYTYSIFSSAWPMKIWYDPVTFRPIKRKREMEQPLGAGMTTVTETYDEWSIDGNIPEEKFKLPEKK